MIIIKELIKKGLWLKGQQAEVIWFCYKNKGLKCSVKIFLNEHWLES
jgi:hypothetical protein